MSAIQMTVILASIIDFGYAMLSVYEQIVFGKLFDFQMIIQKPSSSPIVKNIVS